MQELPHAFPFLHTLQQAALQMIALLFLSFTARNKKLLVCTSCVEFNSTPCIGVKILVPSLAARTGKESNNATKDSLVICM